MDIPKNSIVIGLGSNINALENLRQALVELRKSDSIIVHRVSRIYESQALLKSDAPTAWNKPYLNAAVLVSYQKQKETAIPLSFYSTEKILNKNLDSQSPEQSVFQSPNVSSNQSVDSCLNDNEVHFSANLLKLLKNIEFKLGRNSNAERWAPRKIDLDILYLAGQNIKTPELQIPHSEILNRPFAYQPAYELLGKDLCFKHIGQPLWSVDDESQWPMGTKVSKRYFWPKMIGILNVTTDSFSDGGRYLSKENFLAQAEKLVSAGAELLDLGAESTRPGATAVAPAEEFTRLDQALSWIAESKLSVGISIDSRNFETLSQLVQKHKIHMINDVSGSLDVRKALLAKEYNLFYVVMHSLSIPADRNKVLSEDIDIIQYLINWWSQQLTKAQNLSFNLDQLVFDPGIGFGKTQKQNEEILNRLSDFYPIKNQIYIGHSRKTFLDPTGKTPYADRDRLTAQWTQKMNLAYVQYLRVHNVKVQRECHDIQ